ncbi:MAG TPA: hypothetical protein VGC14_05415 [Rhizobium sp.]
MVSRVEGLCADGDMVIVLWYGQGVAKDGKPYRNTYTWYLEIQDDEVTRAVVFFDPVAFNELWARVSAER